MRKLNLYKKVTSFIDNVAVERRFPGIFRLVEKSKLKARQLEKILDQPQPRLSELPNSKISKMSAEKSGGISFSIGG